MKPALFDNIAFQYDENRGGEPRGARFAEALIPLVSSGEKVLELGVGTGVVAGALQNNGYDVVGVDISREMLRRATDRVRTLVWADMNRLPFLDEYFGSVYSVWALHLAGSIEDFLGEIRRVLRSGGCFLNCSAANGPVSDEVGRIVWEMQRALSGPELTSDSPERLAELGPKSGFLFEGVAEIPHEYATTPNAVALHLERRGMSTLQKATPEQEREIIQPAIDALRAMANPDEQIVRRTAHKISIFRAA